MINERTPLKIGGLLLVGISLVAVPGQLTGWTGIGLLTWAGLLVYEGVRS